MIAGQSIERAPMNAIDASERVQCAWLGHVAPLGFDKAPTRHLRPSMHQAFGEPLVADAAESGVRIVKELRRFLPAGLKNHAA
ncbi:MAG: hypothetical protein ACXIUM_14740 [Wenzhouxiangella sp.]